MIFVVDSVEVFDVENRTASRTLRRVWLSGRMFIV